LVPFYAKFGYINLLEPSKSVILSYLGLDGAPPHNGSPIPRKADVAVIDALTGDSYEITAVISPSGSVELEKVEKLPEGTQVGITPEELLEAEQAVKKDERVLKLCADVGKSKTSSPHTRTTIPPSPPRLTF
jgi:Cu2+-containing amine oxidase